MQAYVNKTACENSTALVLLTEHDLTSWLANQLASVRQWVQDNAFLAKAQTLCCISGERGQVSQVLIGIKSYDDPWALGHCPAALPKGTYHIEASGKLSAEQLQQMSLSWVLGAYQFDRYRTENSKSVAVLALDDSVDEAALSIMATSYYHVRDLINTPAQDLMPAQFADYAEKLAEQWGAKSTQITGNALLEANLHAIHAVGRASVHAPRLTEITWGDKTHRHLTLVGKGVCFDTGGLNIKPGNSMLLMKKDMGGAALALGLAALIMAHKLPVYLRVLLPMVDNAVSGDAYRPSDVIKTHKGLQVEITDTDAEGRLVLADALSYAQEDDQLDLIMDFATLTGAARVAVGPDIPSFFTQDDAIASQINQLCDKTQEILWRLPLYSDYNRYLKSQIADLKNASLDFYAGAITAALFLQRFVNTSVPWIHIDFMGWNVKTAPGRPEGGEAQGLRTLFQFVCDRYGVK